jgi:hypothetical protein
VSIRLGGPAFARLVRPERIGPGHARKIGLLGAAKPSRLDVPWQDPSWIWWAHAMMGKMVPIDLIDHFIDIHPPHCFQEQQKNGFDQYYTWLQRCRTPVWMQQRYPEIPASERYPIEQVKTEFPGLTFGSQTAYLIALALLQGVTHLGFWGVHYSGESEREEQRRNCELWIGIAIGRGVHIIRPESCPLAREPVEDYGYESHRTPEQYAARKAALQARMAATDQLDPRALRPMTGPADYAQAEAIRLARNPGWAWANKEMARDKPMPAQYRPRPGVTALAVAVGQAGRSRRGKKGQRTC